MITLEMIWEHIEKGVASFEKDPAETDYQKGYEACLLYMKEMFVRETPETPIRTLSQEEYEAKVAAGKKIKFAEGGKY